METADIFYDGYFGLKGLALETIHRSGGLMVRLGFGLWGHKTIKKGTTEIANYIRNCSCKVFQNRL